MSRAAYASKTNQVWGSTVRARTLHKNKERKKERKKENDNNNNNNNDNNNNNNNNEYDNDHHLLIGPEFDE